MDGDAEVERRAGPCNQEKEIMTTTIRSFAAAMLLTAVMLFAANAATAACTAVKVTNNLNCDVQLCLFDAATAATICTNVPAGATVIVNIPAGFTISGGVSAGHNRYRFGANGCTVCYAQVGPAALCCGEVCYDPTTCHITIGVCTQAICNP